MTLVIRPYLRTRFTIEARVAGWTETRVALTMGRACGTVFARRRLARVDLWNIYNGIKEYQ